MNTVIILDGHVRSSLVAARSLHKCGYHVVVGSPRWSGLTLYSRATDERFRYPSPLTTLSGFTNTVIGVATRFQKPLILSFSDATTLALSRQRERFSSVAMLAMPSVENVEVAFDKYRTAELGRQLGVPVPPTVNGRRPNRFPVVIKPRHNIAWHGDRGARSDVVIVGSQQELDHHWAVIEKGSGEEPFIQEAIEGPEYGYCVTCRHGEIVARCVHRRVRSLSPQGGASAVRVSVDPLPGMAEAAERLLKHLAWHGPAMVEFKVGTDGVAYLIEINGRFWGSLALTVFAGVDMPALVADETLSPAGDFRRGVYARYFAGDVAHLVRSPWHWRTLKDFIRYGGPDHFSDLWSWRDPLPAFMDIVDKVL